MKLSVEKIDEWARAYVAAQLDPTLLVGEHPLWWAVENLMLPSNEVDPEDCWRTILAVLQLDPPAHVRSVLAAGPLEDLIEYAGPQFIDRIESEAVLNKDFEQLLLCIYQSGPPEVWNRVDAIRKRSDTAE